MGSGESGGERRSDLRYFLEIKPTGPNNGLDVGYRGKDLRMNLGW